MRITLLLLLAFIIMGTSLGGVRSEVLPWDGLTVLNPTCGWHNEGTGLYRYVVEGKVQNVIDRVVPPEVLLECDVMADDTNRIAVWYQDLDPGFQPFEGRDFRFQSKQLYRGTYDTNRGWITPTALPGYRLSFTAEGNEGCTGSANCKTCKNCHRCKYCHENGGHCGVCTGAGI